jgi:type II secretory pathway component PulL
MCSENVSTCHLELHKKEPAAPEISFGFMTTLQALLFALYRDDFLQGQVQFCVSIKKQQKKSGQVYGKRALAGQPLRTEGIFTLILPSENNELCSLEFKIGTFHRNSKILNFLIPEGGFPMRLRRF